MTNVFRTNCPARADAPCIIKAATLEAGHRHGPLAWPRVEGEPIGVTEADGGVFYEAAGFVNVKAITPRYSRANAIGARHVAKMATSPPPSQGAIGFPASEGREGYSREKRRGVGSSTITVPAAASARISAFRTRGERDLTRPRQEARTDASNVLTEEALITAPVTKAEKGATAIRRID